MKKIISCLLIIAFILSFAIIPSANVEAASKKAVYRSTLSGKKVTKLYKSNVKTISISGNKLILNASLDKAKNKNELFTKKSTHLAFSKRTYTISSKCKFYFAGGEGPDRKVTKKAFLKQAKKYGDLALYFYTDSSGAIYKMVISI